MTEDQVRVWFRVRVMRTPVRVIRVKGYGYDM